MQRTLLKAKIHRATVTDANLEYEGSVTIDSRLLELADIVEYEQVHIYNITNGNRLVTYAISGPAGSGTICINGAGASGPAGASRDHLLVCPVFRSGTFGPASPHRPCGRMQPAARVSDSVPG